MVDRPDLNFHYNREERLSMSNAPDLSRRGRKGFLKSNRSLIILLVDIALICVLFIAYRAFFFRPPYLEELSGYRLTLRGMALSDRIVASLWVESTSKQEENPSKSDMERIFVRFSVGEEELRVSEKLLLARDEPLELAASLFVRDAPHVDFLRAEVQIGQRKAVLERRLEGK